MAAKAHADVTASGAWAAWIEPAIDKAAFKNTWLNFTFKDPAISPPYGKYPSPAFEFTPNRDGIKLKRLSLGLVRGYLALFGVNSKLNLRLLLSYPDGSTWTFDIVNNVGLCNLWGTVEIFLGMGSQLGNLAFGRLMVPYANYIVRFAPAGGGPAQNWTVADTYPVDVQFVLPVAADLAGTVTIRAQNQYGQGPWSDPVPVTPAWPNFADGTHYADGSITSGD